MAPSSTTGAAIPRCRRPPRKGIVSQCPRGRSPRSRSPRGARPRSRTIAVFVQVSSMNTSRAGSNRPCSRIQRRRARATSARFCSTAYRVFFEADVAPIEEPPQRATAARNFSLSHRRDDLVQRQIRLVGHETEQKFRMLLQRRGAAATWLCGDASGPLEALRPDHYYARTDAIVFGRLTPRRPRYDVFDHAGTQVVGIRLRHRSPPKNESIPPDSLIDKHLGILPDSSRAKFALDDIEATLDNEFEAELNRTGIRDLAHVAYSILAKATIVRRDNLRRTVA